MIATVLAYSCDLSQGVNRTPVKPLMALANKNAHIFQINVMRNGVPETLTGAGCSATFVRADDVSVPLDGEIAGSTASVTLTDACYRVPGKFKLTINLSTTEITSAIFIGDGSVMTTSTDTIVDEEGIIPSIEDVIAQQQAAVAATNAANQAASKANSAASAANTAAGNANTAASSANSAVSAVNNATVTQVNTLDNTQNATASVAVQDGAWRFTFGLPRGLTGAAGGEGNTVPMTADELESKSASELAAIYTNGARWLQVTNNNTVVCLSLKSDGSTEFQSTNMSRRNLLDNSDFVHPVAQAGVNGAHGATGYAVDRWMRTNGATVSQAAAGLEIVSDKTNWVAGIQQRIKAKRFADVMTFAVRGVFPVMCRLHGYLSSSMTNFGTAYFRGDAAERTLILKLTKPDGLTGDEVVNMYISPDTDSTGTVAVVSWAALYEGEYTAEILPPYVPKGYAAELAECLRYYRKIKANSETFPGYAANGVSYAFIPLQAMRIAPTVMGGGKFYYTFDSAQGTTTETATAHNADENRVVVKCAVSVTGIRTGVITPQSDIDISADL